MYLYNLTLQRSQGIVAAIHGNFSGSKLQEIVVSRGKVLELFRHDPNTGKIFPILSTEVFGVLRSLMPFRLTGGNKGLDFCLHALAYFYSFICDVDNCKFFVVFFPGGVFSLFFSLEQVLFFLKNRF